MTIAVVLFALFFSMNVHATEPTTMETKILYEEEVTQCELSSEDKVLLQQIAMAEAEDQGIGGMAFVMQTIMNRVNDANFPNTVQQVVAQDGQFVVYTNGTYLNYKPNENSRKALWLIDVLENRGQLYFENSHGVESTWHSRNLIKVFEYGVHTFYK